jgi:transcriptional regulator with XRE-family HTH domain
MLDKLKAIQERDHLTDGDMARRLGISRSLWNLIRNGKMELSDAVAMTAAGVWPELSRDLLKRAEQAALSVADSDAGTSPAGEAA